MQSETHKISLGVYPEVCWQHQTLTAVRDPAKLKGNSNEGWLDRGHSVAPRHPSCWPGVKGGAVAAAGSHSAACKAPSGDANPLKWGDAGTKCAADVQVISTLTGAVQ